MLQSESWHENHEYAPLKGTIDEKKEQNKKIPNRTTHNSYINTRQEIAKKKVSIPLDKLTFLQQVWSISGEIRASTRKPHWLLG